MDLRPKTQTITFGEKRILGIFKKVIKFKVIADIPDSALSFYSDISKLENVEDAEQQKKSFELMKKVVIEILANGNKRKEVVKFINGLGIKSINKIFIFLNEFINIENDEKKNN